MPAKRRYPHNHPAIQFFVHIANFKAAAAQWIVARRPWETSEAFLFGPVADKGLDPNIEL